MMLAALTNFYQRLRDDEGSGIPGPGYSQEKISYAIVLGTDGTPIDVIDIRDTSGNNPRPTLLPVPQPETRTVAVQSNFLWDKTSYVLGVSASSKRSDLEHAAFKTLHQQLLADNSDPGLRALLAFLTTWTPENFQSIDCFQRQGEELLDANLVFRLDGEQVYLHNRPAAREAWASQIEEATSTKRGVCLVTGENTSLTRLHPKIKGVNGAQSSGAAIISFNHAAFTSYGKDQGDNAPISETSAFAYTTALNHLLRRDASNRQRVQIGDTTAVFWAEASDTSGAKKSEDLLAAFFNPKDDDKAATQRLAEAMQLVRQGKPLRSLDEKLADDTRIFVLGLAPNASRLSIRFWETETLARFARRLTDHFDDLQLEPRPWRRLPSLGWLALATAPLHGDNAKAKAEDISPRLAGELARAVLTGSRYPQSLLSTLVMRFRADGHITGIRVALCKAVLARSHRMANTKGAPPVSLDTSNTDPGYLLGRLFSALENAQAAALGNKVSSTIRDRYYGAASATPASIFPVLLRNVQNHLARLRKDKPGLAVNMEKDIGKIIDALPTTFPRSLPIDEQGRFAIGYYHQSQARFAGKKNQDNDTESEGEDA